jgi:hypothetical protein
VKNLPEFNYKIVEIFLGMIIVDLFNINFVLMKNTTIIILCFSCLQSYGQDDWTLYPEKNKIDSGRKIDSFLKIDSAKDEVKIDSSIELNYIAKKGFVIYNKDFRLDSLNKFLAENGKYPGYSIQLIVSQETQKIKEIRKKFIENFPEETLYDEYIAPNIYLYAGKFRNKHEAVFVKKQLEHFFENTMIIVKSFPLNAGKKIQLEESNK